MWMTCNQWCAKLWKGKVRALSVFQSFNWINSTITQWSTPSTIHYRKSSTTTWKWMLLKKSLTNSLILISLETKDPLKYQEHSVINRIKLVSKQRCHKHLNVNHNKIPTRKSINRKIERLKYHKALGLKYLVARK